MRICGKILVPQLISYDIHTSQRAQINFFSHIQPSTKITVIECATSCLLSDVLHCNNMNTDFIDFRK